jgi:hypothetical protein
MSWYSNSRRDPLTKDIFHSPKPEGKFRETYSNEGLTHAWASGNVPRGRSSTMFFENGIIYSFGHHYKAAKIYTNRRGEKLVLINSDDYSPTTRKHLSLIRRAVSHLPSIEVPNVDVIDDHASNIEFWEVGLRNRMSGIFSMKGWHGNGDTWLERLETFNTYLKFFDLETIDTKSEDILETVDALNQSYNKKEERAAKMRKTREENLKYKYQREQSDLNWKFRIELEKFLDNKISLDELKKHRERKVVKGMAFGNPTYHYLKAEIPASLIEAYETKLAEINTDQINAWRRGELSYLPWNIRSDFALLRVKGETVQTSQSAEVPLSHALRLLNLIERKAARVGERVGHYTLTGVESLKDVPPYVTIGCHKILLSEAQTVLKPYKES